LLKGATQPKPSWALRQKLLENLTYCDDSGRDVPKRTHQIQACREWALSSVECVLWGIKLRTASQKNTTNPPPYPRFPKSF
jgi:hypothetical protein